MKLIQKAIDHNTTYTEINNYEKAFFTLFDRLPEMFVTGHFVELKTNEVVFAKSDKCKVLIQHKTGKPVFLMFEIDGEICKATIEENDKCILVLK